VPPLGASDVVALQTRGSRSCRIQLQRNRENLRLRDTDTFFVTPERMHIELSALRDSQLVPHQSVCVRVRELRATTRGQDDGAPNSTDQPLLFSEKNAGAPTIRSSLRPARTAGRIFGGAAYEPSLDRARLSVQVERIRGFMLGVEWRSLREIKIALENIHAPTLFPEASISAQLRNLKKPPYFYRLMKRRRVGIHGAGGGIWEDKLLPPAQNEDAKKKGEFFNG